MTEQIITFISNSLPYLVWSSIFSFLLGGILFGLVGFWSTIDDGQTGWIDIGGDILAWTTVMTVAVFLSSLWLLAGFGLITFLYHIVRL